MRRANVLQSRIGKFENMPGTIDDLFADEFELEARVATGRLWQAVLD